MRSLDILIWTSVTLAVITSLWLAYTAKKAPILEDPVTPVEPNKMGPKIAFVTTCRGRAGHLLNTLPRNMKDNEDYDNCIFIVVNYNSCEDDLYESLKLHHRADVESGRLVIYNVKHVDRFKMAHAKNVAHRAALREGAEILCNLDADNLTNHGFATWIAQQYKEKGKSIYLWGKMVKGVLPRGISGRIVVTKEEFIHVGGYDEQYADWGRDDKDFNERLQNSGYTPVEIDPKFLGGLRHNDRLRFKHYPHARPDPSCDSYDIVNPEGNCNTVVNWGCIGEALCWRNFDETIEIEICRIPTRIFGIGMHKTGTTSLHKALSILGFDSAHWTGPRWARTIWEEMTTEGRSLTLEKNYAFCDLPFPLLYKELDRAYPGSKFILTLREEDAWIRSVERHYSPETNKWRNGWGRDCFTHKVHTLLYGRRDFNREVMLERYRRHNEEVLEYFKDRKGDLFIVRIHEEMHWDELCLFLGKEKPESHVLYPHANKSVEYR